MSETYIFGNVGQSNAQIGTNTMLNTIGSGNSAFGNNVFTDLSSGVNNSGFGVEVASGPSFNGSNNTAFGVEAIKDATTASDASAFGYQALTALTTGTDNTSFGSATGGTVTTTSSNTIVGANADVVNASVTNSLSVGYNSIGADKSISVGAEAQCRSTGASANNIVMGYLAEMGDGSSNSIIIGPEAGNNGSIVDSIGIGTEALGDVTSNCDRCLFIGWDAGGRVSDVTDCVGMGEETAIIMKGTRNTALGSSSLQNPQSESFTEDNTGIGYYTGQQSSGRKNTFSGHAAGAEINTATGVTAFGGHSMEDISGDSTRVIATNTFTALGTNPDFTTSRNSSLVLFTVNLFGNTTDAAGGTASAGGAGELTAVITTKDGSATSNEKFMIDITGATTAGIDGKYFLFSSTTTDYYLWYDIDNVSVDPAVGGRTGVEVNLTSGASESTISFGTSGAIRDIDGFREIFTDDMNNGTNDPFFRIINTAAGNVTDIAPGTAVGVNKMSSVNKVIDGGASGEYSFVDFNGTASYEIAGTYFTLSSPGTDYYVWYNSGTDTDPGPPGLNLPALVGRTGIEITYTDSSYNTAAGWSSLEGHIGGGLFNQNIKESTVVGYSAGRDLNTGSHDNTIFGANSIMGNTVVSSTVSVGANITTSTSTEGTFVGAGTSGTSGSDRITVIGPNSSVSGVDDSFILGPDTSVTTADTYQIGPNSVSGAAIMSFRTQTVVDEAWIGGGSTSVVIDNNGDIVRGTDSILEVATTDITTTTMETYTMADNTTRQVEALVMGTRTGGDAGLPADTYSVRLDAAIKRTGAVVTVSTVTEIHIQDAVNSIIITNVSDGNTLDIADGNAVGGGTGLQTVVTTIQGTAITNEISLVDFTGWGSSSSTLGTRYFLISSSTTDYYIWWDFGFSTDPAIPSRTGIHVIYSSGDDFLTVLQKTATAVEAVGGVGTTFNTTIDPSSTLVEVIDTTGTINTTDIDGGTAVTGVVGGLNGVFTIRQGVFVNERSCVDTFGATAAGIDGKYFLVTASATTYYIWFDVDNTSTDPGPGGAALPRLAGLSGIEVDISAGDSDVVIATKTSTAVESSVPFTVYGTGIKITNDVTGVALSPASDGPTTGSFWNSVIGSTRFNYLQEHVTGAVGISQQVIFSTYNATGIGMDTFISARYFNISSTTTDYYVWYDYLDPDPAPAGRTAIPVVIVAGDTDLSIARKTVDALNAVGGGAVFTATPFIEAFTVSNTATGDATDIEDGNLGSLINQLTVVREGASAGIAEESVVDFNGSTAAGLQSRYFLLSSPTVEYYVWFNNDASGVDPAFTGTGIPVATLTGDTIQDIASKTAIAIDGVVDFTSALQSPWVIDIVASGTDAILQVIGSEATDITWKAYTRNFAV
jgi:hypothetical protein